MQNVHKILVHIFNLCKRKAWSKKFKVHYFMFRNLIHLKIINVCEFFMNEQNLFLYFPFKIGKTCKCLKSLVRFPSWFIQIFPLFLIATPSSLLNWDILWSFRIDQLWILLQWIFKYPSNVLTSCLVYLSDNRTLPNSNHKNS